MARGLYRSSLVEKLSAWIEKKKKNHCSWIALHTLDEKHQVCDDFIQARGVLESIMAKVEPPLVDLRREPIRWSIADVEVSFIGNSGHL